MAQETNQEKKDFGEVFFQWRFPEFPAHDRSRNWYIVGGIVVALLLLYSVFTRNFLFAVITIIATLVIIIIQRNPREILFKITEDGVVVNDVLFEYKTIKNFYIIYNPPEIKALYFEPKSIFKPRIPVALEDQDPVQIRTVLLKYLTEDIDREHEPVSEQFSRFFKL